MTQSIGLSQRITWNFFRILSPYHSPETTFKMQKSAKKCVPNLKNVSIHVIQTFSRALNVKLNDSIDRSQSEEHLEFFPEFFLSGSLTSFWAQRISKNKQHCHSYIEGLLFNFHLSELLESEETPNIFLSEYRLNFNPFLFHSSLNEVLFIFRFCNHSQEWNFKFISLLVSVRSVLESL